MAYVDKTSAGGVVKDIHDTACRAIIASHEDSNIASSAHAKGSCFIYNDLLYLTTIAIAIGDTITPGVNCAQIVLCDTMGVLNHNMDVIVNALEDLSELLKEQHNPSAAAIIDQAILDLDTLG